MIHIHRELDAGWASASQLTETSFCKFVWDTFETGSCRSRHVSLECELHYMWIRSLFHLSNVTKEVTGGKVWTVDHTSGGEEIKIMASM